MQFLKPRGRRRARISLLRGWMNRLMHRPSPLLEYLKLLPLRRAAELAVVRQLVCLEQLEHRQMLSVGHAVSTTEIDFPSTYGGATVTSVENTTSGYAVSSNGNGFQDTNLQAGTTYSYTEEIGGSSNSDSASTPSGDVSAPYNVSAGTIDSNGNLELQFQDDNDQPSLSVQDSTDGNSFADVGASIYNTGGDDYNADISGLAANTQYYLQIYDYGQSSGVVSVAPNLQALSISATPLQSMPDGAGVNWYTEHLNTPSTNVSQEWDYADDGADFNPIAETYQAYDPSQGFPPPDGSVIYFGARTFYTDGNGDVQYSGFSNIVEVGAITAPQSLAVTPTTSSTNSDITWTVDGRGGSGGVHGEDGDTNYLPSQTIHIEISTDGVDFTQLTEQPADNGSWQTNGLPSGTFVRAWISDTNDDASNYSSTVETPAPPDDNPGQVISTGLTISTQDPSNGNIHPLGDGMLVQPDGKILVTGKYQVSGGDYIIRRYNANGTLDTSFGTDGEVQTNLGSGDEQLLQLAIQPLSGGGFDILASGYATGIGWDAKITVVRYTSSGALDDSFGMDDTGTVVSNLYAHNSSDMLRVLSDGSFILAGASASIDGVNTGPIELEHYSASGTLDSGYGTGAGVTTDLESYFPFAPQALGDSKVLAGGWNYTGSGWEYFLERYDANGTLDSTFGSDNSGKEYIPDFQISGSDNADEENTVLIQSSGYIVVGGEVKDSAGNYWFALKRFSPNGIPDTSFGNGGSLVTAIPANGNWPLNLALESDDSILATGPGNSATYVVRHYTSNGQPDNTYNGGTGVITTSFFGGNGKADALLLDGSGGFIIAGQANGQLQLFESEQGEGSSDLAVAPSNLTANADNDHEITLTWEDTENLSGTLYNIYRGAVADFTLSAATLIAQGVSGTTYLDTNALPDTTYYYEVTAGTLENESPPSESATATTSEATLAATGQTVSATRGVEFLSPIAHLTEDDPRVVAGNFTASVDWGDSSDTDSQADVEVDPAGGFDVIGDHTYAMNGDYTITVYITDITNELSISAQTTATVSDAEISASAANPVIVQEQNFDGPVANFTYGDAEASSADFSATVSWDGAASSPATVLANADGSFSVVAANVFSSSGEVPYTVQISHTNGTSATVNGDATIASTHPASAGNLAVTPETLQGVQGENISGLLAIVNDSTATSSDLSATILWGDGYQSAGTVTETAPGVFAVTGDHAYITAATYVASIVVTDGVSTVEADDSVSVAEPSFNIIPLALTGEAYTDTGTVAVASFVDPDAEASATGFSALITWGDGSTSVGTINQTAIGAFTISGDHTYTQNSTSQAGGAFPLTISVTDPNGTVRSATTTATIASAPITADSSNVSASAGQSFSATIATFSDSDTSQTPSDFTATIDWGDGQVSAGQIVVDPVEGFDVVGSHTYTTVGTAGITVIIADNSSGASSTICSTATIEGSSSNLEVGLYSLGNLVVGNTYNLTVATFAQFGQPANPADYAATIDWGDGVITQGTVADPQGELIVQGSHQYFAIGQLQDSVTVISTNGYSVTQISPLSVVAPTITVTGSTIDVSPGTTFTGVVGTFTDPGLLLTSGSFSASITWGDGTTSNGVITAIGSGQYSVSGSHFFETFPTDQMSVDVTDPYGQDVSAIVLALSPSSGNTTVVTAPTDLDVEAASASELDLTWTNTDEDADSIEVWRSSDGVNYSLIATLPSDASSYADQNLPAYSVFFYKVCAIEGSATSTFSTPAAGVTLPLEPTDFQATANNDGTVNLTWSDAIDQSDGFAIYRSVNGQPYQQIAATDEFTFSYDDIDAPDGCQDSYEVEAYDVGGYSVPATSTILPLENIGLIDDTPANGNGETVYVNSFLSTNVFYTKVGDNSTDPNQGGTLQIASYTDPAHGSLEMQSDGEYAYTPDPGYIGTDTFTYTATDNYGAQSDTATVAINVIDNTPPEAPHIYVYGNYGPEGAETIIGYLPNIDNWYYNGETINTLMPGFTVDQSTRQFSYSFPVSGPGTPLPLEVPYTISDGDVTSNIGTITLDTEEGLPPPSVSPYYYSYTRQENVNIYQGQELSVAANDPDGLLTGLTFHISDCVQVTDDPGNPLDKNRQVAVNEDGSFDFKPDPSFTGLDWITYKIGEYGSNSEYGTVWIDVQKLTPEVQIDWAPGDNRLPSPDPTLATDPSDPTSPTDGTVLYLSGLEGPQDEGLQDGSTVTLSFDDAGAVNVYTAAGEAGDLLFGENDGDSSYTWTIGTNNPAPPDAVQVEAVETDQTVNFDVTVKVPSTTNGSGGPGADAANVPPATQPSATSQPATSRTMASKGFIAAFDGTMDSPSANSDIWQLYQAWPRDPALDSSARSPDAGNIGYTSGPGGDESDLAVLLAAQSSDEDASAAERTVTYGSVETAVGYGAVITGNDAFQELGKVYRDARAYYKGTDASGNLKNSNKPLDVIGYSRGAVTAVKFLNLMYDSNSIPPELTENSAALGLVPISRDDVKNIWAAVQPQFLGLISFAGRRPFEEILMQKVGPLQDWPNTLPIQWTHSSTVGTYQADIDQQNRDTAVGLAVNQEYVWEAAGNVVPYQIFNESHIAIGHDPAVKAQIISRAKQAGVPFP